MDSTQVESVRRHRRVFGGKPSVNENHEDPSMPHRPFVDFLQDICEEANKIAKNEDLGYVEYEVKELRPNLTCVQARFVENDEQPDEAPAFRLFAAGRHKDFSMIKIEGDHIETILVSSNPAALLAVISF